MDVFAHMSQNTMSTYVTVGWDLGFELFSWAGPQAEFRLISLAEVCCGFDSKYASIYHGSMDATRLTTENQGVLADALQPQSYDALPEMPSSSEAPAAVACPIWVPPPPSPRSPG
jgi:hypothetical protein